MPWFPPTQTQTLVRTRMICIICNNLFHNFWETKKFRFMWILLIEVTKRRWSVLASITCVLWPDTCEFITRSAEFSNRWIWFSFYYSLVYLSCPLNTHVTRILECIYPCYLFRSIGQCSYTLVASHSEESFPWEIGFQLQIHGISIIKNLSFTYKLKQTSFITTTR